MPLIVGWAGGGVGGHPLIWSGGVALAAGGRRTGAGGVGDSGMEAYGTFMIGASDRKWFFGEKTDFY